MFTTIDEECDGVWDENNYCIHINEITYQCSNCDSNLECTECSATLINDIKVTYDPYMANETASCLIPGCVEINPLDFSKCIKCDSTGPLNFLSRSEGICVPDCTQIKNGHYLNDFDNNVCVCESNYYTADDFSCIDCPFPNCATCLHDKCK